MSLMKFIQFRIGDIVQMKKKHPCGSQEWEVMQLGSDMRVKCCGCGHIVLIPRPKFLKGAKKVLNRDVTQDTPLDSRAEETTGFVYKKFASYKKFEKKHLQGTYPYAIICNCDEDEPPSERKKSLTKVSKMCIINTITCVLA